MSKSDFRPTVRSSKLVTKEVGSELLIYDLETNKAFCLNTSIALIWAICDKKSAAEITRHLNLKYQMEVDEDLVYYAFGELNKHRLIESTTEMNDAFDGLSRREIVRRIGLAAIAAMPVITSLIAPVATYAVSCPATTKPLGCPCSTQSSCSSNCCSSAPRTCVMPASKGPGAACIANCECTSTVCTGTPQRCT